MEIVYLIGNGFDLNAGLKTKASEMVSSYRSDLESRLTDTEDSGSSWWMKALYDDTKDIEHWSDFEMALGRFTGVLEKSKDPVMGFISAYSDFREFFQTSIEVVEKQIESRELNTEVIQNFYNGVLSLMRDGLSTVAQNTLESHLKEREPWNYSFISFNYTALIDRLIDGAAADDKVEQLYRLNSSQAYGRQMSAPLHVHGTLSDDKGILLGPDNDEQIVGDTCRSSDKIRNLIIKPRGNRRMEELRDKRAENLIKSADVICVYGMSMGESDATWWKLIGEHLANQNASCLLVYNDLTPQLRPYFANALPDARDERTALFLERAGITEKGAADRVRQRMLVSLGSHAFDLFPSEISD